MNFSKCFKATKIKCFITYFSFHFDEKKSSFSLYFFLLFLPQLFDICQIQRTSFYLLLLVVAVVVLVVVELCLMPTSRCPNCK